MRGIVVLCGLLGGLGGCGKGLDAGGSKRPTILGDKCDIADRASAPLIVDWDASKRGRLESAVKKGVAVPVRVVGCEIEPLWQCELPGKYAYEAATVRREAERIADAGSLYARVPTSAVTLEARLEAGSVLQVQKTTVGRFAVDPLNLAENQLRGQCDGATHFVSAVDVGAFEFSVMKRTEVAGEVKVGAAGGGASKSSEHEVLSADGTLGNCEQGDPSGLREGCQAPIQIDLTPLVPSLTKDEFIAIAVKATQNAYKTCFVEKKLAEPVAMRLVYAVANPNGTIALRTPWNGSIEPVYFECVAGFWTSATFDPFEGPPLVLPAMVYDLSVQPYEDLDKVMTKIEDFYTNNTSQPDPGVPPQDIGKQVDYDYAAHGLTPTDQWQYPWRW